MRVWTNVLLAANVVALLGLVVAPLMVLMTLAVCDRPGSEKNPVIWLMTLAVWSYPLAVAFGGIRAILAYRAGDFGRLARSTCITYSSLVVFLACMGLGMTLEALRTPAA